MNVAIILTVYDEPFEMVRDQVQKIMEFYPNSMIILCYDGVPDYPLDGVVHHRFTTQLKTRETAGIWMDSWLRAFLAYSDADYMLKLDPDTAVLKRIEHWPEGEVVFGTTRSIQWTPELEIFRIHGGGCGYSRPMVQRIVDSEWLHSSEFVKNPRFQDQEDVMLAHLIRKHNLNCYNHPEFSCGAPVTEITSIAHR